MRDTTPWCGARSDRQGNHAPLVSVITSSALASHAASINVDAISARLKKFITMGKEAQKSIMSWPSKF